MRRQLGIALLGDSGGSCPLGATGPQLFVCHQVLPHRAACEPGYTFGTSEVWTRRHQLTVCACCRAGAG
jgi:hypothetical protein